MGGEGIRLYLTNPLPRLAPLSFVPYDQFPFTSKHSSSIDHRASYFFSSAASSLLVIHCSAISNFVYLSRDRYDFNE